MCFLCQYLWKNRALLDNISNQILNGFKYVTVEKGEYWDHQKVPKKYIYLTLTNLIENWVVKSSGKPIEQITLLMQILWPLLSRNFPTNVFLEIFYLNVYTWCPKDFKDFFAYHFFKWTMITQRIIFGCYLNIWYWWHFCCLQPQ